MKYKTYFTAGTLLWPLAALSGMLFCMAQAKIHYYDFVTKDNLKARFDLQDMGIRSELHPEECGNDKWSMPHACFTMTTSEKYSFLEVLEGVRVPDGYASNVSRCVKLKERKIIVMVHLVMHLANEAKIGGPVQYRWMYPIERYLSRLKSYVRNRAYPEGSIAEGCNVEHHTRSEINDTSTSLCAFNC
uniref:DUF4218 domain-containing protein n=1 Tax=Fagus sylvatica TaxID=28930 RepID=A0A2N9IIF2_FAGSY